MLPDEPLGFRRNDQQAVRNWDLNQTPACGAQHTTYVRKAPAVPPSTKRLISLGSGVLGSIANARNADRMRMRKREPSASTALGRSVTQRLEFPIMEYHNAFRSLCLPKHDNATTPVRYSTARCMRQACGSKWLDRRPPLEPCQGRALTNLDPQRTASKERIDGWMDVKDDPGRG